MHNRGVHTPRSPCITGGFTPPARRDSSGIISSSARWACPARLFVFLLAQLGLADNLLLHVAGHHIVMLELHTERSLPLGDAVQLGVVARYFRQRNQGGEDRQIAR